MITIICDICSCDFTSEYNGGRESFIRGVYAEGAKVGVKFRELHLNGTPTLGKKMKNVDYVKIDGFDDVHKNVDKSDILYFNTYFHNWNGNFKKINQSILSLQNYKIFQQHNSYEVYKKIGHKKIELILSKFDEIFFYSLEDKNEWNFKGEVNFSNFLITSEHFDAMKKEKLNGEKKKILYSGRPSKRLVIEALKYKDSISKAGYSLKFSFVNRNEKVMKILDKKGVEYTVGDTPSERYKGVCMLIQTENKGYGLSMIESLKFYVPTAVKFDWACSKYFIPSSDFVFEDEKGLIKLLKTCNNEPKKADFDSLINNFSGQNKKLLDRLVHLQRKISL